MVFTQILALDNTLSAIFLYLLLRTISIFNPSKASFQYTGSTQNQFFD